MAALAGDLDLDGIRRCQHRAVREREIALRKPRHVVHAIDLLDAPAGHQPVVDHGLAAGAAFLGRLEDHDHGAVEIAGLGEMLGRAQQHGGVAVMAAGVHHARVLGSEGHARSLQDRQRIHVGTQADGLAGGHVAAADHADHAGAADAGDDLVAAEGAQLIGDDAGGAMHLVEQFGVLVEIVAPSGHFVGERGNAVDDGHEK